MKLARSIILILLCAAFVPSVVSSDPLNYKVEGETVTVVGCDENASGELVIPWVYNGKPVTSIGDGAFDDCSRLKFITVEGNPPLFFGEIFEGRGLTIIIKKKLEINTFSKSAAPFSLTFETQSDSTYKIEASQDLKKWGEIGEAQGTGSSVKFIERRKAMFPQQYYRVKEAE